MVRPPKQNRIAPGANAACTVFTPGGRLPAAPGRRDGPPTARQKPELRCRPGRASPMRKATKASARLAAQPPHWTASKPKPLPRPKPLFLALRPAPRDPSMGTGMHGSDAFAYPGIVESAGSPINIKIVKNRRILCINNLYLHKSYTNYPQHYSHKI